MADRDIIWKNLVYLLTHGQAELCVIELRELLRHDRIDVNKGYTLLDIVCGISID